MKILYLDCGMGAAGDMLTAALCELMPDAGAFVSELNSLGIPGIVYAAKKSVKCGITGTHMSVKINGEEESADDCHEDGHHHEHMHDHEHSHDHDHEHEHEHEHSDHEHDHDHEHHDHGHAHHHSGMSDIRNIVSAIPVSEKVKSDILAVYSLIAEAESHVHGVPAEQIHFHEVGTMDAVADVTAVCLAIDRLSPDRIIASPVHVGSGHVHCMHGILPVPAPATEYILRGVPIYSGHISGELCTPTGAALLKHFASEFGAMPVMRAERTGYGMGKKNFEQANCLRAILGTSDDAGKDQVVELSCNIDDMSGEDTAFAAEALIEGGALDVWTEPIGMKKGRPGIKLCVLAKPDDSRRMAELIFRHTSTIGIRSALLDRYTLDRHEITAETGFGDVRLKVSEGYGVKRTKPEYADIAEIAKKTGMSVSEIREKLR